MRQDRLQARGARLTMKWKTTSEPNGSTGHSTQIPGLQAYAAWVAIIVTIVGAVIVDRISVEHRLDQNANDAMQARSELIHTIKLAILEADQQKDYVSRTEWKEKHEELAKTARETEARLKRIEQNQWHSLSVLEKLPRKQEPQ